jgi:hypothetical protein
MKTLFSSKTMIALAVAVAAAAAYETEANEQPIPPPASASPLPDGIQPGSPVAQVVKLVQAGVDTGVIQTYISNCPSGFNLDADKIIVLTDAGLPAEFMNAMFAHDKAMMASFSTAAPAAATAPPNPPAESQAAPAPVATDTPAPEAPPQDVTVNNFYEDLAPYGSWVAVDGYGYCWRPNIVVYDSSWRPYCDRGRWIYTDCGWYWNSDYAWGTTFHYGRWFCHPRYGWCWWPDTVWAPSWVTWRTCNDFCGWAPLPPFTVYQPGVGFCYRGNSVVVGFDFGLGANCFTFVSYGNFCQPHPHRYSVPQHQVMQFFGQTTIINNFNFNNHHMQNNGVPATAFGNATHHPIQAVPVNTVTRPGRHASGGGNSPARNIGSEAFGYSAPGSFPSTDLLHGTTGHIGEIRDDRRISDPSMVHLTPSGSPNRLADRPAERAVTGGARAVASVAQHPNPNQNPPRANDLIIVGHPSQNAAPAANNNTVARPSPTFNQSRNAWAASANDDHQARQAVRTYAPPVVIERSQAAQPARTPSPVASAPAVLSERQQLSRGEARQNISQSQVVLNSTPPTQPPPIPRQPQASGSGGYGRGQGWYAQNH